MIYLRILIGHLVGDWFFQRYIPWITTRGKARIVSMFFAPIFWVHILTVTLAMGICTWWWDWRLLLVALSHIVIDYAKYSLIVFWVHNIYKRAMIDQFLHLFSYFLIAQIQI